MKTLLLIAIISLATINGYAQNTKCCPCKNKVVHHKAATVHHKIVKNSIAHPSLPPYITVLTHVPNTTPAPTAAFEPCYTYRQHNIVVQECPATIYKNGDIGYSSEGVFMGYYPSTEEKDENINPMVAPQHTVISNYKGVAPADGNACQDCTPQ